MTLVDRAVSAVVAARNAGAALGDFPDPQSRRRIAITGRLVDCETLRDAPGSRALWVDAVTGKPGARADRLPRFLGLFSGHEVIAIPDDISEAGVLKVTLDARVVASIDLLPTMSPQIFEIVCRDLWGEAWRSGAVCRLDVADRTFRRWLAGTSPIPVGVARTLLTLAKEKRDRLQWCVETIAGEA